MHTDQVVELIRYHTQELADRIEILDDSDPAIPQSAVPNPQSS